ncbi:MAG: O-antigen ligase family protein [Gemmatimonadota bacterium]
MAVVILAGTFLSISRVHEHIGILSAAKVPLMLFALSIVGVFNERHRIVPRFWSREWYMKTIGVMLFIAIIGIPTAVLSLTAFNFLKGVFLKDLAGTFCLWAIACHKKWLPWVARTVAGAGWTACLLALMVRNLDNTGRLNGAYMYDANDIALVACVTMPILLWHALDQTQRFRIMGLVLLAVPLQVLIQSGSRGGMLGLATMLVTLLFFVRSPQKATAMKFARVLTVGLLLTSPIWAPASVKERMTTMFAEDDYNRTSETGRLQIWRRGAVYALTNPVTGVGINNFSAAEGYNPERQREADRLGVGGLAWVTAHNSFVQAWAELGLIGGSAFFYLIFRTLRDALSLASRRARQAKNDAILGSTLALSLVGFGVTGLFLSFAYYHIVYVLLAMIHGYGVSVREPHGRTVLKRGTGGRRSMMAPQGRRSAARA